MAKDLSEFRDRFERDESRRADVRFAKRHGGSLGRCSADPPPHSTRFFRKWLAAWNTRKLSLIPALIPANYGPAIDSEEPQGSNRSSDEPRHSWHRR
jgi:hypothetical protein